VAYALIPAACIVFAPVAESAAAGRAHLRQAVSSGWPTCTGIVLGLPPQAGRPIEGAPFSSTFRAVSYDYTPRRKE